MGKKITPQKRFYLEYLQEKNLNEMISELNEKFICKKKKKKSFKRYFLKREDYNKLNINNKINFKNLVLNERLYPYYAIHSNVKLFYGQIF